MTKKIYTTADLHYHLASKALEAELINFLNDPLLQNESLKERLLYHTPDEVLAENWRLIDEEWANTIADPIRLT